MAGIDVTSQVVYSDKYEIRTVSYLILTLLTPYFIADSFDNSDITYTYPIHEQLILECKFIRAGNKHVKQFKQAFSTKGKFN